MACQKQHYTFLYRIYMLRLATKKQGMCYVASVIVSAAQWKLTGCAFVSNVLICTSRKRKATGSTEKESKQSKSVHCYYGAFITMIYAWFSWGATKVAWWRCTLHVFKNAYVGFMQKNIIAFFFYISYWEGGSVVFTHFWECTVKNLRNHIFSNRQHQLMGK